MSEKKTSSHTTLLFFFLTMFTTNETQEESNQEGGGGGGGLIKEPTIRNIEEIYIVPENFALVSPFIYRSAFPKRKNFPFLKRLGLKSIL
jgi:hypothetical protein